MSHYVGQFRLIPNNIVGGVSYSKLSESDKQKANLDMANRQIIQDEIKTGYIANLIQSEKQRQAVLKVAEGTYELNASITKFASSMDMRMIAINEQVSLINTGVESLREVMMIPDQEKDRLFNFKEGIRYLEQSLLNPKRYVDALHFLIKSSDMNHRDYLVNHEIGKIYLYNSKSFDIDKAIKYLQLSLDYCETEAPMVGAEVAQHLAFAAYLTNNFDYAIDMAELAYSIDNDKLEAKYIAAECKILRGDKNDGINDLKSIISVNRSYIDDIKNNNNISKLINIKELESVETVKVEIVENLEYEHSIDNSPEMEMLIKNAGSNMEFYTKLISNGVKNTKIKEIMQYKIDVKNGVIKEEPKTSSYKVKSEKEMLDEEYKYDPGYQVGKFLGHLYNLRGVIAIGVIFMIIYLLIKL